MAKQSTFEQVANNAQSTLSGSITNVATTINVASGHGARFPTPGNGFYATIWDSATYADPFADPNMEVVKCTALSTDALTVTRAQRGTSGVAHSSGVDIRLLADSELISDIQTAVNTLEAMRSDNSGFYFFDDMLTFSAGITNLEFTVHGSQFSVNGTGTNTSTADRPGIADFSTAASASSGNGVGAFMTSLLAGGGTLTFEGEIRIDNLATVGEDYALSVGFGDTSNHYDQTDGCYLLYKRGTSANWIKATASNGTRTETASSTAVATGWTKVKIVVNAGGTSAEYYINGVSIGTVTTNIPTGAGRVFGVIAAMKKTAGTTARVWGIDYYSCEHTLTTAR
jgi:hypothetical protein